ncbi:MAG TPA: plastocyanin/azurin family copper-binding protein [Ilumatobacteraceae bacterium]|nr:plastocyanin/azurin family copper-binding protein [Ilumatobacteraceae bacterium]
MAGCAADYDDTFGPPLVVSSTAPTASGTAASGTAAAPTTTPGPASGNPPPTTAPPTTATPVTAPRTGVVVRVIAQDNLFRAATTTVHVGDTVQFQNVGRNDHDVIPIDDSDAWGVAAADFTPGDVYEHVFDEPGEYAYYCSIHATNTPGVSPLAAMVGTVIVTD